MSSATFLATSISKPINSPCLLRIAHGTKVDMPTINLPRFLIVSITLSEVSCCWVSPAKAPVYAGSISNRPNRRVSEVFKTRIRPRFKRVVKSLSGNLSTNLEIGYSPLEACYKNAFATYESSQEACSTPSLLGSVTTTNSPFENAHQQGEHNRDP